MFRKCLFNSFKLFCKSISCFLPFMGLIIVVNYLLINNAKAYLSMQPMMYFGRIRNVCFFLFAFFVFIAYEFIRKSKEADLHETLDALGINAKLVPFSQFFVLFVCVLLVSINVAVYSWIGCLYIDIPTSFISK